MEKKNFIVLSNMIIKSSEVPFMFRKERQVVLDKDWPQYAQFIEAVRVRLQNTPTLPPHYPGAADRYRGFAEAYPVAQLEMIPSPGHRGMSEHDLGACLPWLLVHLDKESDTYALQNEAFSPVLAIYTVSTNNDADTWAKFLVEEVFLDVCGFPAVLRSDRGTEFTNEIIAAVNKNLHVKHVFGAAFHPQSQGYIEGRHKPINSVLRAYCGKNKYHWATFAKLAQWAERPINNATLGAIAVYNHRVPAFRKLYENSGRSFPTFYSSVRKLMAIDKTNRELQLDKLSR